MLQEQLRLAPAQAHVEARGAPAVVGLPEARRGDHLVDAEGPAIAKNYDAGLEAAIRPKPHAHVHVFPVNAPHLSVFRSVVHGSILEQLFA